MLGIRVGLKHSLGWLGAGEFICVYESSHKDRRNRICVSQVCSHVCICLCVVLHILCMIHIKDHNMHFTCKVRTDWSL